MNDKVIFQETIDVTMTVTWVGEGGNSPSGKYQYGFSPDLVHVTKCDTQIRYTLDMPSFDAGFRFEGYYSSDSHKQLQPVIDPIPVLPAGQRICVYHLNDSERLLINVLLMVIHIDHPDKRVGIDPQITNTPAPRVVGG